MASLAARDGHAVTLIAALARDPAGRELAALLAEAGVEVVDLGLDGATPEKVRIRSGGHSLLRLDRGRAPGVVGQVTEAARSVLDSAAAVLVSDYGITGTSDEVGLAHAVARGTGLDASAVYAGRTTLAELATLVAIAGRVVCGDGSAHSLGGALRTDPTH